MSRLPLIIPENIVFFLLKKLKKSVIAILNYR